ncbi:hypothetical protein Tco_1391438 [Tanacetum coccineum]
MLIRIPPSSKPKSPYKVRVILPKKQVAKTQHAEVTVATADATKSLVAFEFVEEQGNQPSAAEAEKGYPQPNRESESALIFSYLLTPPNSGIQRNGNNGVLRQSTTIKI